MVVSSHVLDEVERFGSRVLVIAQGRLAAEGDFRAIRDLMDDRPTALRRADRPAAGASPPTCSFDGLRRRAPALDGDRHGWSSTPIDVAALPPRRSPASPATVGARLCEVRPLDDDLESVFRYLVGTPG